MGQEASTTMDQLVDDQTILVVEEVSCGTSLALGARAMNPFPNS
jgi:hypothetical protein